MKPNLSRRHTQGASVIETAGGLRLTIPASDGSRYDDAQLDDYTGLARRDFPHRSLDLSLRARASAESTPGTWGFGVWNDPFGLSLGFGGNPFRLPALPNAAWFFYASPQNYLSFKDNPSTLPLVAGQAHPAHGFLAQTFRAPRFHPALIGAGLALPFSRIAARRGLGRVIAEDAFALSVDVTQWHGYRLRWREDRVIFEVDDVIVLETSVSPHPPLGFILWIDNQFAAFTPAGKISFGVLAHPEAWLEIEGLELKK
ncbi:MAG: hypothetical protein HY869_12740 [Chloroflexi bacterium]|nr:hypothetical protein [Chloroflexota bacterium]